jgi:hypothetical protein
MLTLCKNKYQNQKKAKIHLLLPQWPQKTLPEIRQFRGQKQARYNRPSSIIKFRAKNPPLDQRDAADKIPIDLPSKQGKYTSNIFGELSWQMQRP